MSILYYFKPPPWIPAVIEREFPSEIVRTTKKRIKKTKRIRRRNQVEIDTRNDEELMILELMMTGVL